VPTTRTAPQLDLAREFFAALADETRLRIVLLLVSGEACVCTLHESLDLPQPNVSRHLAVLRSAGIVEARRDGKWTYYRLAPQAEPVLGRVIQALRRSGWKVDRLEARCEP
jgi:ArsR family transcriptional regulator, arsenate/arsenite/antimonite-responsive transcriptional repressor